MQLQKTPKARTQWGSKLNSIGDGTQPIVYMKVEGHWCKKGNKLSVLIKSFFLTITQISGKVLNFPNIFRFIFFTIYITVGNIEKDLEYPKYILIFVKTKTEKMANNKKTNGKDPAVLLYTQDFLVGTISMNFEERGKYITLLCMQHQKGKLTLKDLKSPNQKYIYYLPLK